MLEDSTQKKGGFHYGWIIVVCGFMTQLVLMFCLQAIPLVLSMMIETFNCTMGEAGIITGTIGLFYGGMSFFWGGFADKFGPRLGITLASVVASVSFICFGLFANDVTSATVLACFIGFGAAGVFSAVLPKLIGRWFHPKRRGRAMALITPGGTIMGMILASVLPITAKTYGWEIALVGVGVVGLVVTVLLYIFLRNDPAEKGLVPNGSPDGTKVIPASLGVKAEKSHVLQDYKIVLKQKITYHLALAYIPWTAVYMLGNAWISASFVYAGMDIVLAGAAVTIQKLFSFFGQQIWGNLSDKIERKWVISMSTLVWILGCIFFIMSWGNLTLMYVGVAIFSLGIGVVPCWLSTLADYYPTEYKGAGAGCVSTFSLIGRYFGPVIAGMFGDAMGLEYAWVFAIACMAVSGLVALTFPRIKGKEDLAEGASAKKIANSTSAEG